jgi:multidrug resistance protein MdtO
MSTAATHRGGPPDVDDGAAPSLAALLRQALRSTPGRLGDALRIVVVVLIVVTISEIYRMPETAISAILVLGLSQHEAVSTVLSALITCITVVLAIFVTIAVFMFSLSEPALRIPLMALTTFAAMFLSRAATMGAVFFAGGFMMVYGLSLGDQVLGLALQPATAGNATPLALPEIVFVSPEEALVQFLLWLSLAVAMPLALLVAANLLMGRDPARILRDRLAERLATAARFCAGEMGAEHRLDAQAFEGGAQLRKLHHLAGLLRRGRRRPLWNTSLIDDIGQLVYLLLAWLRVPGNTRDPLAPAAGFCRAAEQSLRAGQGPSAGPPAIAVTGATRPLADAISRTLGAICETLTPAPPPAPSKEDKAARSPRRLLAPDAFSNPEYVRFALKVTLAVMICYLAMNLANWSGIATCVPTAFLVALGTIGETRHKAMLRIIGCLIGAALGLGAILLLMPQMTNLGDLLLLLTPVTLLAAWICSGTERIAYAGLQIGLAFYLIVLQGFGPTLDMEPAKDRIIGILLGNIVIFVIFTTIWPVSVADVVRTNVAKALEQLAKLAELGARADGTIPQTARSAAGAAFGQAIARARAVLINDRLETGVVRRATARRPIDATLVEQIGRLFIPVSMILDLRADPAVHELPQSTSDSILAHHEALAVWFGRAIAWVHSGEGADEVSGSLPEAPVLAGPGDYLAALATWYGLLHEDIRRILDEVGPQPRPAITPSLRRVSHALG